jgi:hypothetical protein
MSGPRPITRQRSSWKRLGPVPTVPGWQAHAFVRNVSDGQLRSLVAEEPQGWHLSISFINHRGDPSRYPTWDEISHARYELLPDGIDVVMHLPPAGEYVAVHETTFHLHEHPERES